MRTSRHLIMILITVAVAIAIGTMPFMAAWGHASLVKSSPASGAALTASPPVIRAWFSEELAVKGSTLKLLDAHKTQVGPTGGVDSAVAKHDVMKLTPPKLAAGTYSVQWHAISTEDGEVRNGSFQFSVKMAAQTMAPPTAGLPPLTVIAPADHARVKNPVVVVIETPGDIEKLTVGSGMAGMSGMGPGVHLHIMVGNQTIMPTAKDLTKVGASRYEFQLAPLSVGTHTIKVYWADNKTHEARSAVHAMTCTITG